MRIRVSAVLCFFLALAVMRPAMADEVAEEQAIMGAAKAAILSHDIEALETMSRDFRESKSRTSSGAWKLDCFYITFEAATFVFGDHTLSSYKKIESLALDWMKAHPESKSGNIVYAMALLNEGWEARGGGYAQTVSADHWKQLRYYGGLAREQLEKTRALASDDPQWYATMIELATVVGWPRADFAALSKEALAHEPTYARIIANIVKGNYPKWGGTRASLDQAVADIVAATPDSKKAEIYARSYWFSSDEFHHEIFLVTDLDWQRMKAGFAAILRDYPTTWNLNGYARFACLALDQPATLSAMQRLGDAIDIRAWDDPGMPEFCRNWSGGGKA